MLEALKRRLRGEHNSIRYRFVGLPKEWLVFLFRYKLAGRSWVDFYADRLDAHSEMASGAPLKKSYAEKGKTHLDYLVAHGLEPEHKLLDFGCGVMRSGVYFAAYLQPNGYTGADISEHRLERGRALMREHGVPDGSYEAILLTGCELGELEGRQFDMVWANSVLTHMPEDDIATLFKAMRWHVKPGGRFFFTYSEADTAKRRGLKDFWYPRETLRALCEAGGFQFEVIENYEADRDDVMGLGRVPN